MLVYPFVIGCLNYIKEAFTGFVGILEKISHSYLWSSPVLLGNAWQMVRCIHQSNHRHTSSPYSLRLSAAGHRIHPCYTTISFGVCSRACRSCGSYGRVVSRVPVRILISLNRIKVNGFQSCMENPMPKLWLFLTSDQIYQDGRYDLGLYHLSKTSNFLIKFSPVSQLLRRFGGKKFFTRNLRISLGKVSSIINT